MPSPDDLPGAFDPAVGVGATTTVPGAATNGHARHAGDGRDGDRGPALRSRGRPPGPSTKPALIVLGVILLLFLSGIALELGSGSQGRPTPGAKSIATARGAVLHAVPARPLVTAITAAGEPPDDLLDALAVPQGSAPVPGSVTDLGVELYDESLRFTVPASQADVISFFRAQLPSEHWQRISLGPTSTGSGYLILEQHPASDGHEWDVGVTVSPTTFAAASPGSGASTPGTGTTTFTLRLYSISDQD